MSQAVRRFKGWKFMQLWEKYDDKTRFGITIKLISEQFVWEVQYTPQVFPGGIGTPKHIAGGAGETFGQAEDDALRAIRKATERWSEWGQQ